MPINLTRVRREVAEAELIGRADTVIYHTARRFAENSLATVKGQMVNIARIQGRMRDDEAYDLIDAAIRDAIRAFGADR